MTNHTKKGSLSKEQIDFYNEQGYIVLPNLLSEQELEPAKEAMNKKVSMIAEGLMHAGLISDKLEHRPFKYRLAELFADGKWTKAETLGHQEFSINRIGPSL